MPVVTRPQPKTTYRRRTEENDQVWLVKYVKENYPEAIIECDYAAGLNLTNSQRIKMIGMRSDRGMPDVRIYYPSRGYHGLMIELKKEGVKIYKRDGVTLRKAPYTNRYKRNGRIYIRRGDHNEEQAATLQKFEKLGYCARYAIGRDHAKELVDRYFDKQQTMF